MTRDGMCESLLKYCN